MNCGIARQIAVNADESEGDYCSKCESPVTEQHYAGVTWLECDSQQCGHSIELGGDDE